MSAPDRLRTRLAVAMLWLAAAAGAWAQTPSQDLPEYRLKAAFVYNFLLFAEWPADASATLELCIHGSDPFGKEIDALQGKAVGSRTITLRRTTGTDSLRSCRAVFIAASAIDQLPRLLENLRGRPVLTLADSSGAMHQGVALNMLLAQDRVVFEVNLQAARSAGLGFSSKLLRLATEVLQ
jgi:YfiR/HmsC-like